MNEDSTTMLEDRDRSPTDLRPVPPRVAADMRTLERPPADGRAEYGDLDSFAQRACEVLDQILEALDDDLGRDDGITALGVSEDCNTVTGGRGLILRRFMQRGRYSRPLGEIFSPTGLLDQLGKGNFDAFREFAWRYGLDLWIHEANVRDRTHYIAFAIFREREDSGRFSYAARLLVTPYEIEQWRSPFLEVACPRPS